MKFESLLKAAPFSGIRVKPFEGIKRYLSTGDLQGDTFTFVDVDFKSKPSRADIIVETGDVLFARMKGTRKVLQITPELAGTIVSTGFAVVRPRGCDPAYLATYLNTDLFERQKEKYCSGAIQPAITNGGIEKLVLPLPNINDQILIAHLLGKVEGLIAQRKQHLQQLDDLLKSVFLEMFGEQLASGPSTTLGTYISTLSDYHANGSYKTLKKHVQLLTTPDYALMVRTTDLENRNFSDGCNYISQEAYEFLEKSKVYGGEIIVNKIGSAGRVYLMPNLGRPVSLGMNAFLLRFKENLNNIFAYYFLTSDVGTQRIQKLVKGAVTKTITKDAIRSIVIPVINPNHQEKFAHTVEKVEALKSHYQQSLTDLESLYGALSQKAFKGELDLSRVTLPDTTQNVDEMLTATPKPEEQAANNPPAINLPDHDILLDALTDKEKRNDLFAFWLESYCQQIDNTEFSSETFLAAAQTRVTELHPDSEFEMGENDYDIVKDWVFKNIRTRRLKQTREIIFMNEKRKFGNRVIVRARRQLNQ